MNLWLAQGSKVRNSSVVFAETLQEQNQNNLIVTINEEQVSEEDIEVPEFELMSTLTLNSERKALISIDKVEPKWFHVGDSIIYNYLLHDINNSFVTLFDGKDTYYEIHLSDNQVEDDYPIENSDINTVEIDIEKMIPLGDGQYISYGDKDVSGDTGDIEEMASSVAEVDTSGQTIVYGDEDVSKQVDIEDKTSRHIRFRTDHNI